jgi:hypothetical protein
MHGAVQRSVVATEELDAAEPRTGSAYELRLSDLDPRSVAMGQHKPSRTPRWKYVVIFFARRHHAPWKRASALGATSFCSRAHGS